MTATLSPTLHELSSWHSHVRSQFPIFGQNPDLAYLDSCATAQKPQQVLDAVHTYLTTVNANAGRGIYPWANLTTEKVEAATNRVKTFLADPDPTTSSVHFVSGTTHGLRTVAEDWLVENLRDGDEIIVPLADHQANAVPWYDACRQLAARGVRVTMHALPYEHSGSGDYDQTALAALVGPRTRFVAATHVHHVYGVDMNVHRIRETVGPHPLICLDAAQGVGHLPIDLAALDVDFLVFSGHKAMALPGVGVIWSRNQRGPVFAPHGWQGSPNTAGIVSLAAALDWLDDTDVTLIDRWTVGLASLVTDALSQLDGVEILGCQSSLRADSAVQRRQGIVTFRHRSIGSHDVGFILASQGLMVRSDSHCQAAQGEKTASVRVSVHAYTSIEETNRLIEAVTELEEAR